ncbi:MAG TPA: ABC transporter permease [Vicinamibacterales bacterium]|nr:ABC transporter permease [Vicinamibacterales bacterium]
MFLSTDLLVALVRARAQRGTGDREPVRSVPRVRALQRLRSALTPTRLGAVAFIAILLVAWHVAIQFQASPLLPGPLAVAAAILELLARGLLLKYVVASLFRVTWGFVTAALLAIPFGLAVGWYGRAERAFNPFIQILRPISPLAWIPIAILWFGVGDLAAIFLIFLASFLPLTVTAMNAVASIPDVFVNAGRNFGLRHSQVVYRVLYPAVMPQLIIGLRISLGIAWLVVVAAEMIAVNSGLGFLIIDARNAGNRYDLVVAGMVMIGVIGLLLDVGIRSLERIPSISWGYSDD